MLDFVPVLRPDTVRRTIDADTIVWSSLASAPTVLDPVDTVLLDVLDGEVTVGELATEVHDEVGLEIGAAQRRVSNVVNTFHVAGLLTASSSDADAADAIAGRELFVNPCIPCMSNAVEGMTSLSLRFGDRIVGVATDSRRAVRRLTAALGDHIDDRVDNAPVGFVLTAPAGFQRHHHLADRSGFVHSTGRGLTAGLHAVASHLTAFLPVAPGLVRIRAGAVVSDQGKAAVCLFPLLLVPPVDDEGLARAGWARIDRLAADIEVATGRIVNPDIPWSDLAELDAGAGHAGTGADLRPSLVLSLASPGVRPMTRAEVVASLASGALSGSPADVLDALIRLTDGLELGSVPPGPDAIVERLSDPTSTTG
jgi:hypothetical protein